MTFKLVVALISVLMTLGGYYFYFTDIFAGKTKPHAYSWLVWGLLTGIAFFGQLSDGAGAGAWVTGVTAAISFIIVILSLRRSEQDITTSDKLFLGSCVVALVLWPLTNNPLLSMILITIIDFLGFLPTIRKSIRKPYEETLIHYIFAGGKFALALMALDNISIITFMYPFSLVLANWVFVVLLLVQRAKLKPVKNHHG